MGRTTVNPPFNLARAVQLLIHAFGPQEAATRIRLECGAIISVRERVAHVIAFPRPACLGDRHSVYDAGLGTLNADFCASIGQRSEEHTSELQSLMRISYAVFCLKKKKYTQ